MAKKNILAYEDVLNFLESKLVSRSERHVTLNEVELAFKALTDKHRAATINEHIATMCDLRLLVKKGDITYRVPENWKAILEEIKKQLS